MISPVARSQNPGARRKAHLVPKLCLNGPSRERACCVCTDGEARGKEAGSDDAFDVYLER